MNEPVSDPVWAEVADWLGHAEAYREPGPVQVIETHISRVYLVGEHAFKLKKPLQFDFLDYSTAEKRRWACEAEIDLNRRLADDVYEQVTPICREANDTLALDGPGEPVEWLVQMRRLNADDTLEARCKVHRVDDGQIQLLVERLADFYRQAVRPTISAESYRAEILRHVRANRQELLRTEHRLDWQLVERICQAQIRGLLLLPDLFDARVAAGCVVDGHGDLRPDHIYFTPQPQVIDCIEFNAEFRRLDMADELCFLEVECDRLAAPSVGRRIADACFAQLDDQPPAPLLTFYRSYRACVRAKVAVLRAQQLTDAARQQAVGLASEYLRLAEREIGLLPPPILLVVRGLMGSGKSSLARWLSEHLSAEVFSSDVVRRELLGEPKLVTTAEPRVDEGHYQPAQRQRVYEELFRKAEGCLAAGQSVILDATFIAASNRQRAKLLAQACGAAMLQVFCDCPANVAKARIAARIAEGRDASEARPELYEQQAKENEPDADRTTTYTIDSLQPISIMGEQVLKELRNRMVP